MPEFMLTVVLISPPLALRVTLWGLTSQLLLQLISGRMPP
jgi:hypothetical protein